MADPFPCYVADSTCDVSTRDQGRSRNMGVGGKRPATALFALVGALSLDHMHAFAARMGSSALVPAFVKNAPSSLWRKPRCVCPFFVHTTYIRQRRLGVAAIGVLFATGWCFYCCLLRCCKAGTTDASQRSVLFVRGLRLRTYCDVCVFGCVLTRRLRMTH